MMFVVTENMFNNVPFFNFMEKHNSVNRSVSIVLSLMIWSVSHKEISEISIFETYVLFIFLFFVKPKENFKGIFSCTFKLKLRDTYFDCESKIIIWIMCVYVLIWWTEKTCTRIFSSNFLPASKTWLKSIFYTKRHTKYGVILTTLIFMFLALDLYSRNHDPNHFVPWWQISVTADINRLS